MISETMKIIKEHLYSVGFLLCTFGIYISALFTQMIQKRADGLYLGHEHVWSDWPLHIGMIWNFATKDPVNWFTNHPMYAHGKFTYSFLTNLISSLFVRTGFSLEQAIIIPSILYVILLIIGMYALIYLVSKSKRIAVVAICIFFLSAGPGFIDFAQDFVKSPTFASLLYPERHYSRIDQYSWYAGNVIVGMIIPQRAFLLGFTLSIWVLACYIYAIQKKDDQKNQRTLLLLAGMLAGILPIAHMHSFIAVVIISGIISLTHRNRWRELAFFVLPAAVISTLLYLMFVNGGIENKQFMHLQVGFTAKASLLEWLIMWWRIWGLTLPLAIIGFFAIRRNKIQFREFYWGFFTIFILANLVLFQPIEWDNAKLFYWAYFGFSILAANLIVYIANGAFHISFSRYQESGVHQPKSYLQIRGKIVAAILLFSLTATGLLELARLSHVETNAYQGISNDDMKIAEEVRSSTDPNAIFLTSTSTNHWVMMWAARPMMMGFVGWVNNFGFLYQQRLDDMQNIYTAQPNTEELLKKYQISYVVIGPGEIADFHANEIYFSQNYPLAFQNMQYRVYDTRSVLGE